MIGQCHAIKIMKCKGIHKSQLQSWRRNTSLCHRLERARFWWPSSMFITTPSSSSTWPGPAPSSVLAIAPEKKCEMCVTVVTVTTVQHYTRHRDTQQGGWRGPAPEVILSPDTDHDGYLRSPGSSVWTMLTSDNERSVGRQSALASSHRVKNEAETKFLWFKVVPRLSFINYMQPVSK